ncbi:MAG: hypothetical protein OEV30_02140, partial [Ignavibacteria bacterium]|nr:hypothetical protein [Ignavibacteria bacterium]
LLRALHSLAPDLEFLITTGNRDGRIRASRVAKTGGPRIRTCYLPWDRRRVVRQWLRSVSPLAVVTLESDIWPNLILSCRDLNIPVHIVNGRIDDSDLWGYRLASRLFRAVLPIISSVGVQNQDEGNKFVSIGARRESIYVGGNLKFDTPPPDGTADRRLQSLRPDDGPLIIAGSTHGNEEEIIVRIFIRLRAQVPGIRLVLAPRRIVRARRIHRMLRRYNMTVARWSLKETLGQRWEVMLVDEIGSLDDIYRFGAVAIVGGTFVPHGGHNPIEPARFGVPVIAGPHHQHFDAIMKAFAQYEAIILARGPEGLEKALTRVLIDPSFAGALGDRGRSVVEGLSGSADRYARSVLDIHLSRQPSHVDHAG